MKNLNNIASDLFNKIRGRFPNVTIGDQEGVVTTVPEESRFYDFAFTTERSTAGKVSVSLDEENGVIVIVGKDIIEGFPDSVKEKWFEFLRELRQFAKKRMMQFDVRDISKSNLQKRDYQHLVAVRPGENTMAESKMYGTHRTSYQKIGNARLAIKHTVPINTESATARTQKIGSIFIESPDGERFRYPFAHLSGARAMARHVAEGGTAYDDFGKHISGLSEELSKLRKFSTYMNRSGVMAETLSEYSGIVKERAGAIRKEIQNLQKETYYRETVEGFTVPIVEDVPDEVSENWIDQLTIKQFNEELKDVFPYIYKLVGEATKAKNIGPEDLDEAVAKIACTECDEVSTAAAWKKNNNFCPKCKTSNKGVAEGEELDESGLQYYTGVKKHGKEYMKKAAQAGRDGASQEELGRLKDKYSKAEKTKEEIEIEETFESIMGQFSDHMCEDCGNLSWRTLSEEKKKGSHGKVCWKGYRRGKGNSCHKVSEDDSDIDEAAKKGLYYYVNKRKKAGTSRPKNSPKAPSAQDWKNAAKTAKEDIATDEGNAFANAVRQAKMNGKKKGDKIAGPDGKEITLEKDYNFSGDDLAQLQKIRNVDEVKRRAIELITTNSTRPMRPEKVAWFKKAIASKRTPMDVIKLMYDLMLSGDGIGVIGSGKSMGKSSYRKTFDDVDLDEAQAPIGTMYMRFKLAAVPGAGLSGKEKQKNATLMAWAGFANTPEEMGINQPVKREFRNLSNMEALKNAVRKILTEKVFIKTSKLVIFHENDALFKRFPHYREFISAVSQLDGNKVTVQFKDNSEPEEREKGPGKKRVPYGHVPDSDVVAPEKTTTTYFRIDNPRLMAALRQMGHWSIESSFRPALKMFVMEPKEFEKFRAFLKDPKVVSQYGRTMIQRDASRSFAETDVDSDQLDREPEKPKTPLGEFILSYFDRESGKFPKGETAVLTAVEKDYGDQYVEPARQFIEQVQITTVEYIQREAQQSRYPETEMVKRLAGI